MQMCKIQASVAWKTRTPQASPVTPSCGPSVSVLPSQCQRMLAASPPPCSVLAQDSRPSWGGRQPAPLVSANLGARWSRPQAPCRSRAALAILKASKSLPQLPRCAQARRSIFLTPLRGELCRKWTWQPRESDPVSKAVPRLCSKLAQKPLSSFFLLPGRRGDSPSSSPLLGRFVLPCWRHILFCITATALPPVLAGQRHPT